MQNQLSGPDASVNQTLTGADFPFHRLSNPNNNGSAVLSDKRQIAGSAGVVAKALTQVEPGLDVDAADTVNSPSPFFPAPTANT